MHSRARSFAAIVEWDRHGRIATTGTGRQKHPNRDDMILLVVVVPGAWTGIQRLDVAIVAINSFSNIRVCEVQDT